MGVPLCTGVVVGVVGLAVGFVGVVDVEESLAVAVGLVGDLEVGFDGDLLRSGPCAGWTFNEVEVDAGVGFQAAIGSTGTAIARL